MLLRLDADVFTKKPSYVTLTFGMNDTGYADVFNKENTSELSQQRIDKSIDSFGKIIDAISSKLPLSKVVMIGGSPYDETSRFDTNILKGKNTAIQTIIKEQQRVAEEREWGFVDFNQPMCDISAKLQTESPEYSFSPQDRIHPDKDGQMVMAFLFLEAQGLAGVKVSDIEVDAQSEKAILSENCKISSIRRTNDGVAFSYLAKSLPYPCDSISENGWGNIHSQKDALKLIPFTEKFNQERLCVKGLDEGKYVLYIDNEPIDTFTSAELEIGINMAEYVNTPQYRQASAVMYLNEERLQVEKRFREYIWMQYNMFKNTDQIYKDDWKSIEMVEERAPKDWFVGASNYWYRKSWNPEIREVWGCYMESIVKKIYKINNPVKRRIELSKVN